LKNKLIGIKRDNDQKLPIEAQTFGLYQGSTNIVWKFEENTENNNNAIVNSVSGTFHFDVPGNISVLPFHYGRATIPQPVGSFTSTGAPVKSDFDIANELWEIMWNNTVQMSS